MGKGKRVEGKILALAGAAETSPVSYYSLGLEVALHQAGDVFQHNQGKAHDLHEAARRLAVKRRGTDMVCEEKFQRRQLVGVEKVLFMAANDKLEALKLAKLKRNVTLL
jgi:hypothetical protein